MNTLIPTEYYTYVYYYFLLLLVLLIFFRIRFLNELKSSSLFHKFLLVGLILYMGFRPISGVYFGDMAAYANFFEAYSSGYTGKFEQDPGFDWFMRNTTNYLNIDFFFLLLAFIYVYAHYWAAKRFFSIYWFYAFIMFVTSFSFWSYGTNGLRNGLAASFILLAFSFERKKILAIAIAIVAVSFHKSMLLPVIAYFITFISNKSEYYIVIWIISIPISLFAGGAFEIFFISLGFDDQRISYLIEGNVNDDNFSSTGFRWDFLLYSASAIAVGLYFVIKKQFKDDLYQRLLNVYLMSNAFWILVIRANFSNRFAYLSWFMMGLIIIYPFLKENSMKNHPRIVGWVLFIYFSFTFIMNIIITKE